MQGRSLTILAAAALVAATAAAGAAAPPDRIDLPDGWQPEGIAAGRGHTLYVGSIPTGAVYRLNARTGEGSVAVPGLEGRAAIGLKVDRRRNRLFVAGGDTGRAFVYSARSGADLAEFQLAPADEPTFVNDVALARKAAYFTDSLRPSLYVVSRNLSGARELPLQGFDLQEGFNLNGIVAVPRRRALIAVQSNAGRLWRINRRSGRSIPIDLGGATVTNGDGLLLKGRRLYVVQNRLNQIAVVRLGRKLLGGRVVRTITHPDFDVPTTIARLGRSLYAANARFDTPPMPDTEYWVTRVRK
jgi:sugar lactone lactonase YvrE